MESGRWQMVAWAVAAALVVMAGMRMLGPGDPPPPAMRVDRETHGASTPKAEGGVFVHVAGAVRQPGLLRVPSGARVAAAIARAGGPARGADLSAVNLAQPLEDGQQVVVPRRGGRGGSAGTATTARGGAGPAAGAAMPSLATATVEELDGLDGIGPTLAKRIVEYRQANGGFRSLDELREVDGIGEKRFATLQKALRP